MKKRPRRAAVSAVMARRPAKISLRRLCGMPVAFAAAIWVTPSGAKYSSRRVAPGCVIGILVGMVWASVVVDDLDLVGIGLGQQQIGACGEAGGQLLDMGGGEVDSAGHCATT